MAELPALEKLSGTVDNIVKLEKGVSTYSQAELNQAEDKIRNEFQVIEALLSYVGQEFYVAAQARRQQLRRESVAATQSTILKMKEAYGTTGSSGNPGDRDGTDKPSRAKREGDKQTRKSSGRTGRKK